MLEDFVAWYEKTAHKKVKIEYSSLGTNEDLYNQLTLGDKFDLVCPSEYMIMKLMLQFPSGHTESSTQRETAIPAEPGLVS